MESLPDSTTADEFIPSAADEAWAAAAFNTTPDDVDPQPADNGQPTNLADEIADEGRAFRAIGTPTALLIADHLDRLAQLVRWTGARTPAEHADRMDSWDAEIQARYYDQGYSEGYEAARREVAPFRPC